MGDIFLSRERADEAEEKLAAKSKLASEMMLDLSEQLRLAHKESARLREDVEAWKKLFTQATGDYRDDRGRADCQVCRWTRDEHGHGCWLPLGSREGRQHSEDQGPEPHEPASGRNQGQEGVSSQPSTRCPKGNTCMDTPSQSPLKSHTFIALIIAIATYGSAIIAQKTHGLVLPPDLLASLAVIFVGYFASRQYKSTKLESMKLQLLRADAGADSNPFAQMALGILNGLAQNATKPAVTPSSEAPTMPPKPATSTASVVVNMPAPELKKEG